MSIDKLLLASLVVGIGGIAAAVLTGERAGSRAHVIRTVVPRARRAQVPLFEDRVDRFPRRVIRAGEGYGERAGYPRTPQQVREHEQRMVSKFERWPDPSEHGDDHGLSPEARNPGLSSAWGR